MHLLRVCGRRPLDCPVLSVSWAVLARCSSFLDRAIGHANRAPWYINTLGEPSSSTPSHMPVANLSDPLDLATILDVTQRSSIKQVSWLSRMHIQHAFLGHSFAAVVVFARPHRGSRTSASVVLLFIKLDMTCFRAIATNTSLAMYHRSSITPA